MKKIWNNMPITRKLMSVTVIFFLALCVGIFFCQVTLFEGYYTHIKGNELEKAALKVGQLYDKSTGENIDKKITEIAEGSQCYIMIIGNDGSMKYMMSYYMTVKTQNGEILKFSLDQAVNNKDFLDMKLGVGDNVAVKYFHDGNTRTRNILMPYSISSQNGEWKAFRRGFAPGRDEGRERPHFIEIDGVTEDMVLPSEQTGNLNAQRAAAAKAAMLWINEESYNYANKDKISYFYNDIETDERFSVYIKKSDTSDDIVFAISPLGMVHEAAVITRNMFAVWFLLAMVAACVLGMIFSYMLTRPMITFSAVTKRMASLDFGIKCEYKANDEIGELANNINFLSDELDNTIEQLKTANEKLMRDIEKERALEKSRKEFVAAASHELKTPISIIRAYTEALTDGVSLNKKQRYTDVIINETEKMDKLIGEMLEISRYDAGVELLNMSACNINEMLRGVFQRFDESFKRKNIDSKLILPDEEVRKEIDIEKIERVIINFISNAEKNTPEGGEVICKLKLLPDGAATLSVENSGSHIPDEELSRVWERYYKADKARNRKTGGTGLGLAIAKNILEAHNADFWAENTDYGVEFGFLLK